MRRLGVCLVCAACGSPSHPAASDAALADATADTSIDASADAAADGSPDAANVPPGPITVTVFGDGTDAPSGHVVNGAQVDFLAPDGTDQLVITGADGVATVTGVANTIAFVVHRDSGSSRFIFAYEGLMPNDSIVDGDPTPPGPDTCIGGTTNVTFPAFGNAPIYTVSLSCSTGTQSSATTIPINCIVDCSQVNAANVVVSATDGNGQLGFSSVTNIDETQHVDAAHPIVLPTLQPASTITASFTNMPQVSSTELLAFYRSGSDPVRYGTADMMVVVSNGSGSKTAPIVPFGDTTQLISDLDFSGGFDAIEYTQTLPQLAPSVTIDGSTIIHPAMGGAFDAMTESVTWTESTDGVDAPSLVKMNLRWFAGTIQVRLVLTAPHGATTSLVVPHLPTNLAQLDYSADQVSYVVSTVAYFVGKSYHDALVGQTGDAAQWHTAF